MERFLVEFILLIVLILIGLGVIAINLRRRSRSLDNRAAENRILDDSYQSYLRGDISLDDWMTIKKRAEDAQRRD